MLRGYYTATNGMIAQQRRQQGLANNAANINTPGYKADQTTLRAFPELLIYEQSKKHVPTRKGFNLPISKPIGNLNTGVYAQELIPKFDQGDLKATERSTDLALVNQNIPDENGGLFYTVINAEGEMRLTRNGNFSVDGNGFLTTGQGLYVLDENGQTIQVNNREFTVSKDGQIQSDGGNAQIGIAYVENTNDLTKEGDNLFQGDVVAMPNDANFKIEQGFLETSNVNALYTRTEMMQAFRLFEANQRVLKAYDESMEKAVNQIARLM